MNSELKGGESTFISEATFLMKEVLGVERRPRRRSDKAHEGPVPYNCMTAVELDANVQIARKVFGQVERQKCWASCGCREAGQLYPQPEVEEGVRKC